MLKSERKGSCVRVALCGEIDHCSAQNMRLDIENAVHDPKIKTLVLDFSDVSFMDSSGVGMLIGRYKTMKERGGSVSAVGLNAQVEKLFRLAGLHRIISIGEMAKEDANEE